MTDTKIDALAKFLNADVSTIDIVPMFDDIYKCGNEEYLIYTSKEKDGKVKDYLIDMLSTEGWIFNLNLEKYVNEDNKYAIKIYNIIDDPDYFTKDETLKIISTAAQNGAIDLTKLLNSIKHLDGVGQLLAIYDGKENMIKYKTGKYYIYRIN